MVTDRSDNPIPTPDAVKSGAGCHSDPDHLRTWPVEGAPAFTSDKSVRFIGIVGVLTRSL